jgi:hypothetical protein
MQQLAKGLRKIRVNSAPQQQNAHSDLETCACESVQNSGFGEDWLYGT